jgi:LytS/YehU family sensor histidine kinase
MYGEAYGLAIACPETGGTRVTLTLPAVRKEEMEECSP